MCKTAMVDLKQNLHSFTQLANLHVILDNLSKIQSLSKFLQLNVVALWMGHFSIYSKLGKSVTFYASPEVKSTTLSLLEWTELAKNKQL